MPLDMPGQWTHLLGSNIPKSNILVLGGCLALGSEIPEDNEGRRALKSTQKYARKNRGDAYYDSIPPKCAECRVLYIEKH